MTETKLLAVDDALARVLERALPLDPPENVPLAQALGRTLAIDLKARRTQPPIDVSAMDGYAVRSADFSNPGARLRPVGESAAGHGFEGALGAGECVRIFTGARVPPGADAILLQEDAIIENGLIGANLGSHARAPYPRAGAGFSGGGDGDRGGNAAWSGAFGARRRRRSRRAMRRASPARGDPRQRKRTRGARRSNGANSNHQQ